MPLRVYLPLPPPGLFEDAETIHDSVRDGVLDWTSVAGPGLPSFIFVDSLRDADIPILWALEPDGDWYIAQCSYGFRPLTRQFTVSRILVTARRRDGRVADLHELYKTVLHEMGHALGLAGHSPDPGDIMYRSTALSRATALSERDRATLAELYGRPIGSRILGHRKTR
jgi:predicted Zn-dependent protease